MTAPANSDPVCHHPAPMGADENPDIAPSAPVREQVEARVGVLLEALPYIREFAGATIVIKYGGAAMTTPGLKASFARDVALLKLVGMNPVIVHGGGPDISRYSDRLGLEVRFVQGLRVTDAPTMELVKMVLVGKINKEIVAQLHLAGAPAVGLAGDDGGLIEAEKASSDEADLGFVGQVASIDPWVLESLSEFVPVVASVGVGADGQSYNINADAVAGRLAAALGARKAIFLTDVEGIFRDIADPAQPHQRVPPARPARADRLRNRRQRDDPEARGRASTRSRPGSRRCTSSTGAFPTRC